jgi:hypothetical protein
MFKKDNLQFGLLIGFIGPLISIVIYYFIRFSLFSVAEVIDFIKANKNQITAIIVPCLLLNIILLTIYLNTHRDKTARGIFLITIVYGVAALLLKWVL